MNELYHPDYDTECRICGTVPCVIVAGHIQPHTNLCGVCFFHDHDMTDWSLWNDQQDPTTTEGDSDEIPTS